jgi:predicted DCC family thiol-disulfide oxidoreductase YuxK
MVPHSQRDHYWHSGTGAGRNGDCSVLISEEALLIKPAAVTTKTPIPRLSQLLPMKEKPMRYTMLYDGNCRICRRQAELVAAYDDYNRIELLDANSAHARERFPHISFEDALSQLHVVGPDGTVYRGAEAVRELLLQLPTLRGLGEILRLPGVLSLAQPLYELVARNRYLFGGTATCDDNACRR